MQVREPLLPTLLITLALLGFFAFTVHVQSEASTSSVADMEVSTVMTVKTLKMGDWSGNVTATLVGQGYSVNVTAVIANNGEQTEMANLTIAVNSTILQTSEVQRAGGTNTTVIFKWDTTDYSRGHYIVTVSVEPVPGENDTSNNMATCTIKVVIPGNMNGDGEVDIFDAILFAGSLTPPWVIPPPFPSPPYNSDINGDGYVDIFDAIILAAHFGQKDA